MVGDLACGRPTQAQLGNGQITKRSGKAVSTSAREDRRRLNRLHCVRVAHGTVLPPEALQRIAQKPRAPHQQPRSKPQAGSDGINDSSKIFEAEQLMHPD